MNGSFNIRSMTRSEMDWAVELARKEGWNPGLSDAECFYQVDPDGFLIGLLDEKPIACISAVTYGGIFGFIGFYIVVPEYRSNVYGIKIGKTALKRLEGQNVGLDGVLDKESGYAAIGFRKAYRNIRFENRSVGRPAVRIPETVNLKEVPFEAVEKYDMQCFPAERRNFLRCWLSQPSSAAYGYWKDNRLNGYGVIRRCFEGYKIGPLFADNLEIAEGLYEALISGTEARSPVYLDIPEVNAAGGELVKRYGMKDVFATARMYNREQPEIALEKVFGVTSFEVG